MGGRPSVATGFRLATRFHRLVAAVWLLSIIVFFPAHAIVQMTAGRMRADLPSRGLDAGEGLVVFFEIVRPIMVPLAVALFSGCLLVIAWCVLWHAGAVRWWLDPETDDPRLARILGHGLPAWWRFARLALLGLVFQVLGTGAPWLPLLADVEEQFVLPLLIFGCAAALGVTLLIWLAAARGAWLLGEPGRRSALVAWVRGLKAAVRQPLRSLLPVLVWALPGLALLGLPVIYDGPAATVFLLAAWLIAALCWVAFFFSYAPSKPRPAPPVSPLEPPTTPYVTTRFPTLHREE
jgi:hypothetical protein